MEELEYLRDLFVLRRRRNGFLVEKIEQWFFFMSDYFFILRGMYFLVVLILLVILLVFFQVINESEFEFDNDDVSFEVLLLNLFFQWNYNSNN